MVHKSEKPVSLKLCINTLSGLNPEYKPREGRSKSLRILRGSGGMLPQENFENLDVNILNFGEILL